MTLAVQLYEFAAQLPDEERYNLASQLRRAATSTPLNIAEGSGCATDTEFAKFLGYSYRSLKEAATIIELSHRIYRVLPLPSASPLLDEIDEVARMVTAFINRLTPRRQRKATGPADS